MRPMNLCCQSSQRSCVRFWLKISSFLARAWNTPGNNAKIDGNALFLSPRFIRFQLFLYDLCHQFSRNLCIGGVYACFKHHRSTHSYSPFASSFRRYHFLTCRIKRMQIGTLKIQKFEQRRFFFFVCILIQRFFIVYICFIFVKYGRCVVKRIMDSSQISNIGSAGRFSRPFR